MQSASKSQQLLLQAFARLDGRALGVAVGIWLSSVIFCATVILLVEGGPEIGPTLGLLQQYFFGYTVTWTGSIVGLAYGFVSGFVIGWSIAFLRNVCVSAYLQKIKLKSAMSAMRDFFDNP